jgi:anti-anti-sigma factor
MEVHVRKMQDLVIISVKGRMDTIAAPKFEERLSDLISKGERKFQIDLSSLEYISSTGLRSILLITKKLKAENGEIAFSGLRGPVKEVFVSSGFYAILKILEPQPAQRRAQPLTDKEYAVCFNAYKSRSTEFTAMVRWLKEEFITDIVGKKSMNILSIGSGTGDFDLTLMKLIKERVPEISYVAFDPNEEHNGIFFKRVQESQIDLKSFQIIPKPFREEEIRGNFDIIHLTHCLYYIEDRKEAIRQAFELLKPHGSLLIFHQTPIGINEIQREHMKKVKGDENEMFSSRDILKTFDELGIRFKFDILISDMDVTDCIRGNRQGRLLLNFILESNLDRLEDSLNQEIISTLKEICRVEEGRYFLFQPFGIFWVKKE